jgi:hypothetical protein
VVLESVGDLAVCVPAYTSNVFAMPYRSRASFSLPASARRRSSSPTSIAITRYRRSSATY